MTIHMTVLVPILTILSKPSNGLNNIMDQTRALLLPGLTVTHNYVLMTFSNAMDDNNIHITKTISKMAV